MYVFGWISGSPDMPPAWDMRRLGWALCCESHGPGHPCRHMLVCDVRALDSPARADFLARGWPHDRSLLLGVDDPEERARLLAEGWADVIGTEAGLRELEARVRRARGRLATLPREREIGSLTLDLFHRDARREGKWLALHPREFGLLWRLSDEPGERVTRRQLLRDVWRLEHVPETNSLEVHVARLRSKLAQAGEGGIIETSSAGGYRLAGPALRPGGADGYLPASAIWHSRERENENA